MTQLSSELQNYGFVTGFIIRYTGLFLFTWAYPNMVNAVSVF